MTKTEYLNPLDQYNGYDYHFILTVSNNSESYRVSFQDQKQGPYSNYMSRITNECSKSGDTLNVNLASGETSKIILLSDSRRTSNYQITDVETNHLILPSKNGALIPTAPLNLTLKDTSGFTFYDFLLKILTQDLNTSINFCTFMLSTVFYGQKQDGTFEIVENTHTMLRFLNSDIDVDEREASFKMTFFECDGCDAEIVANLTGITSISTKQGAETVGDAIRELENMLNDKMLWWYGKYNLDSENEKHGRLTQYMITIPEEWSKFKITAPSNMCKIPDEKPLLSETIVNDKTKAPLNYFNSLFSHTPVSVQNNGLQIILGNVNNVPEAVMLILKASPEFLELSSSTKIEQGLGVQPYIVSNTSSDNRTFVIHVDVYPRKISNKKTASTEDTHTDIDLEYDYIFTGKNKDIINMSLNFTNALGVLMTNEKIGIARLQDIQSAGQRMLGIMKEEKPKSSTEDVNYSNGLGIRSNDPIVGPIPTSVDKTNGGSIDQRGKTQEEIMQLMRSTKEYQKNIALFNLMSSYDLQITIRGNPSLYKKHIDVSETKKIPKHPNLISEDDLTALKKNFNKDFQEKNSLELWKKYFESPLLTSKNEYYQSYVKPKIDSINEESADTTVKRITAKINIKYPNTDIYGNFVNGEEMFTDRQFIRGEYWLLSLETKFNGGDFLQVLRLLPNPIDTKKVFS